MALKDGHAGFCWIQHGFSILLCVRLTFFVNVFIGAKGGQPDFARNKDDVGGAAGFHQDAVRQTTPSGEREPPAQVQDA